MNKETVKNLNKLIEIKDQIIVELEKQIQLLKMQPPQKEFIYVNYPYYPYNYQQPYTWPYYQVTSTLGNGTLAGTVTTTPSSIVTFTNTEGSFDTKEIPHTFSNTYSINSK